MICEELSGFRRTCAAASPKIDLAPSSALVGTNVEIRSFGFNASASEDQEEFDGTTAAVVSQVTKVETRLLDCKV